MKNWHLIIGVAVIALVGTFGWYLSSSEDGSAKDSSKKTLRSRRIKEVKQASRGGSAERIAEKARQRELARKKSAVDSNWDPFSGDKNGFKMKVDLDFDLGDDLAKEMNSTVLGVLAEMRKAQSSFDKKATLKSIQKLLEMIRNGEDVSAYAKCQAVDALKFCGGGIADVLPEITQLAADEDPQVAQVSIEALQELLWDWDTTPQQLADAIKTLLPLTSDPNIISPFIFEMSDLPTSLKVDTTLAIMDSGNKGALEALNEGLGFIYDDYSNDMSTREDVVRYGRTHKDEQTGSGF